MIKVDETEPIGELEAKFPYRDVQIKRGVDMKQFYDLEAEIGRGKFGTVYLCREKATSLALAAKFVGIQRRQDRKNVEREVEIMRTLQHPRLIQLYDAFETDNTMVVILELIEGGELFERVIGDDFILTEKACTIFMRQICEGVAFIHKNNIIHLDLKPENILCLTKTGNRIKIIDFGLARYYEPGSKLQVLFGTPEFVAPEVVNFDQISPATDMWSVGVICYVLLSGLSPFMGDTDVETMANVTLGRYDFDDESFDSISGNAKDFITNLLLNKKEARLTADQCLAHPWLKKKIPPPPPELITTKENLRTFVDNYQNINVIADNADRIITPKPSPLSAVELIAASDKEFMNRDGVKSFSNISNENILPPNRYPVIVTNNNVPAVVTDNNLAVTGAPTTNDDVLNMMNANIPSMPSPPVLDNASAVPPNIPIEPEFVANLNQTVRVDENEMKNNYVLEATNTNEVDLAGGNEEVSANLPYADIPLRVIAAPSVPVATLPFISKSLPAAAAMLDENVVNQLKPLHFPLIPSLPTPEIVDEPIIAHPPVIGTTLPPPKRGSIDIDTGFPKLENMAAKRGSIDVISLIQKRGAIDNDVSQPKRQSICLEDDRAPIEPPVQEPLPSSADPIEMKLPSQLANSPALETESNASVIEKLSDIVSLTTSPSPLQPPLPPVLLPHMHAAPDSQVSSQPEIPPLQATIPANEPSLAVSPPLSPLVFQDAFPIVPSSPVEPARVGAVVSPPTAQPMDDVFIPQPPPVVKALPPSPDIPSSGVRSPEISSPLFRNIAAYQRPCSPEKSSSPYFSTSQLPRSPTSPISSLPTPPRRESPLQKQLDEIPKLSSEILSSLKNMPSLSRTTSYETSSRTSKRTSNVGESTSYKTYEKVTSPRVVSFTEHTSSFTSSYTPKTYTKSPSAAAGKTTSEDKCTLSQAGSRTVSSTNTTIKRSEVKESESSRLLASKKETVTKTALTAKQEADALAFKQKLRSTTPWFSERKAESEKNIEKKSSDINNLLSELGPLEKSPWAREIRKISAKLVEMSKDTTARKQLEEEHMMKMNEQQTARRQKFKVSVLNRDVVFGAAREFYIGGEVSGSAPLKEQLLSKQQQTTSSKVPTQQTTSSKASTRTSRLSPEKKPMRPSSAFKMSSK